MRKEDPQHTTNRLLKWLIAFAGIQLSLLLIGSSLLVISLSENAPTIKKLGSIPWADIANDVTQQYQSMDKNALNQIISNSQNFTTRANYLVHHHGNRIVGGILQATSKISNNLDLVDVVRKLLYDLTPLINKDNSVDLKKTIDKLHSIADKVEPIDVNRFIAVLTTFLSKASNSMSPELLKELRFLSHEFRHFVDANNTKLIKNIVEDTDVSLKNFNKLMDIVKRLKS